MQFKLFYFLEKNFEWVIEKIMAIIISLIFEENKLNFGEKN